MKRSEKKIFVANFFFFGGKKKRREKKLRLVLVKGARKSYKQYFLKEPRAPTAVESQRDGERDATGRQKNKKVLTT